MTRLPYPPDGGLTQPKRRFEDTPSVFEVISKHYGLERNKE